MTYGWRFCPVCKGETHHTICKDRIICNACHTESEVKQLTVQVACDMEEKDV